MLAPLSPAAEVPCYAAVADAVVAAAFNPLHWTHAAMATCCCCCCSCCCGGRAAPLVPSSPSLPAVMTLSVFVSEQPACCRCAVFYAAYISACISADAYAATACCCQSAEHCFCCSVLPGDQAALSHPWPACWGLLVLPVLQIFPPLAPVPSRYRRTGHTHAKRVSHQH